MIGNHSLLKTNNNLTKPSPSNKFSPHLTTKSKSCKIIKENYQEKDELLNTISLLRQELVLKNATVDSLEGQKRGIMKDLEYFCMLTDSLTVHFEVLESSFEQVQLENKELKKTIEMLQLENQEKCNKLTTEKESAEYQVGVLRQTMSSMLKIKELEDKEFEEQTLIGSKSQHKEDLFSQNNCESVSATIIPWFTQESVEVANNKPAVHESVIERKKAYRKRMNPLEYVLNQIDSHLNKFLRHSNGKVK
ncbi:hypothetical protein G6F56_002284 [Rhizopus delemar]|nr:hypothetical protein G6F56_002284 [Rhizopus delemar]